MIFKGNKFPIFEIGSLHFKQKVKMEVLASLKDKVVLDNDDVILIMIRKKQEHKKEQDNGKER